MNLCDCVSGFVFEKGMPTQFHALNNGAIVIYTLWRVDCDAGSVATLLVHPVPIPLDCPVEPRDTIKMETEKY